MGNPFTDHPSQVGESYLQHLVAAGRFGLRLVGAGLACILHALLPFAFIRTGSAVVRELHEEMSSRSPALRGGARYDN